MAQIETLADLSFPSGGDPFSSRTECVLDLPTSEDYGPDPDDPNGRIYGPGAVRYIRYGIDGRVSAVFTPKP